MTSPFLDRYRHEERRSAADFQRSRVAQRRNFIEEQMSSKRAGRRKWRAEEKSFHDGTELGDRNESTTTTLLLVVVAWIEIDRSEQFDETVRNHLADLTAVYDRWNGEIPARWKSPRRPHGKPR